MARSKQTARRPAAAAAAEKRKTDEDVASRKQQKKKQKAAAADDRATSGSSNTINDTKSAGAAVLRELLGGLELDAFVAQYFEKKPLHVRSHGTHKLFPRGLFSKKRVLDTIQQHPTLAYGKDLTVCKYVHATRENFDGDGDATASRAKVARLFEQGYSCQFYQPQRYVDELFRLNAAFEACFGSLAGASAYLTPPAAQALAPHHDDVEVFILQTEGRKKWKLYQPITELAGEHSNDLALDQIGEPWMELTLEEGDVLYFPRGVIHQAATDDTHFSTHVTISVYQHNAWANFLEVALPRVVRRAFDADVAFRRGLPVGYLEYMGSQFPSDSAPATAFAHTLQSLVGKLAESVDAHDLQLAADDAAMDFIANRLPPVATTSGALVASPLDDGAAVRFKDRSYVRLTMAEDEAKEPFVGVYFSSHNCRTHHMGLCTCRGDGRDDDGSDDDGSDEENENADSDEDEDEAAHAAMSHVPVPPQSVAFPGDLAPPLMKLYATYPAFVAADDLISSGNDSDGDAVRAMLVRLWSEGLLDVRKQ